ncbi:MAG: PBSX family phage terminase large subunit [Gammaproteobacteria bacterium]
MTAKIEVGFPEIFQGLFEPADYKAFHGGRGSGKSHSFAKALLLKAGQEPKRILCAREVQRSIRDSVKQLLDDQIAILNMGEFYKSTREGIVGQNGSQFIFSGLGAMSIDQIKSYEGVNIAWVEEAQTISQASLNALIPTIRAPKSELWFSWNPRNVTDPVDKLFRSGDCPPNTIVVQANYSDNPWFPDVLRTKMEWDRSRDPDKYEHVWRGGYLVRSEAGVFKNWRIGEIEVPDDATWYYGADWGFSVDPSTLVRVHIDEEKRQLYIAEEAYRVGCEIDDLPALFDTVSQARKWVITADSARPETISYMKRQGFRIKAAKKGAGSVEDGIEFLKSYDIIINPLCSHAISEFTYYCYKVDPHTDEVLPVIIDANNHIIDATRYAVEATWRRREGVRMAFI